MSRSNGNVVRDLLLGAGLLLAAGLSFLFLSPGKEGGEAEILLGGETVCVLPLSENASAEIVPGFTVRVEDGAVRVESSGCAGQDCVRHRPVSREGESIVCLPEGIVIRIAGKPELDAVI